MGYYRTMKYFDYAKIAYSGKIARGGCGFFSGNSLRRNEGIEGALFGAPTFFCKVAIAEAGGEQ